MYNEHTHLNNGRHNTGIELSSVPSAQAVREVISGRGWWVFLGVVENRNKTTTESDPEHHTEKREPEQSPRPFPSLSRQQCCRVKLQEDVVLKDRSLSGSG